jgi:hypothetical protein
MAHVARRADAVAHETQSVSRVTEVIAVEGLRMKRRRRAARARPLDDLDASVPAEDAGWR